MTEGSSSHIGPWNFGPEGTDFYVELESFERRMISRALTLARGSKREAARLLQVNRTTLLEKLKRRGWDLGIPTDDTPLRTSWPLTVPTPPIPGFEGPMETHRPRAGDAVLGASREWTALPRPQAAYLDCAPQPGSRPQRAVG